MYQPTTTHIIIFIAVIIGLGISFFLYKKEGFTERFLRPKIQTIDPPKEQTPEVSADPRSQSTAIGSITV
jgi:hypothetical protein